MKIIIQIKDSLNCSRTDKLSSFASWFSVDIENVHKVTEVCLLNIKDDVEC